MIYTKPDYYDKFKCIADKCEDTCCAGWQIVIDEDSMKKYKTFKGDYIWKIMACVDWETGTFRQDNAKRCAFLNEENLCELYKNAGEHTLCKTCREYPRHTEEFDGVREITLSISCPEVARILMDCMEPVKFITEENSQVEETEDFSDFDPFLFSILEDARKEMISIIQNRNLPIKERAMLVLGMAHDMQGRINRSEMFACSEVIAKYTTEKAKTFVRNHLAQKDKATEEKLTREMFDKLYKLELLRDDWEEVLHRAQNTLFFTMQESYAQLRKDFEGYKQEHAEIDIHLEQIFVYFLFTYFPGAVYDGEVFAKAQMAVYCTWMVELLWMAEWLNAGRVLEKEKMTKLLYCFSREVEHSDENLQKLDKMMEKKYILK
ncbi:MAG: flagellin lysine-N-methylase [Agathobacter sp.]|nr:flagellin lysine-N-methylase [Agathobacter sp.]